MKNKGKVLALAGVTLLSVATLAACGSKSSTSSSSAPTTYNYVFQTDPKSLDYILTNQQGTSSVTTQMVDGLLENDKYGNLVPSLAEDWKVSADGLTYTYTLRDGVKWYTSDGEEYADVVAEDFVTGLKHAIDSDSESLYIVQDSIKNLKEYKEGKVDFSEVGVKAIDEKTVQYTLNAPESYWNSKTTYGVLFPVNAKFLESKGEDFGSVDPSSILVNGAYFLSEYTAKSSMSFTKNDNYWDKDNVKVTEVKLTYYDGSDVSSLYNNFDKEKYTVAPLFPTDPSYQDAKDKYADSITYGLQDTTTYFYNINTNRSNFTNSQKDDAAKESTKKALLNKDFRQALTFAFDRASWNAQSAGEDAKTKALRNMLTPPTFVAIGEQSFGDVVQSELATLGDVWKDVDLSDAQDGLYNPEKAKAQFEKAKAALGSDVTYPIQLDMPIDQTDAVVVQRTQSMKQSIEASLGKENVQINIIELDNDTYLNSTYYAETVEQQDYDLMFSGWGPDYDDPSTYLDIFNIENGSVVQKIGIMPGENADVAQTLALDTYTADLKAANDIKDDLNARYTAYAKAQAKLTDEAVIIPLVSLGGRPRLTRVVPFSGNFSTTGIKGSDTYKGMELQSDVVTADEYTAARDAWLKEQAEAKAKAQAELADHVEK
ncbi:peptide ABC transporter substrate-binding protein [Streptococcus plurextorum]|uniref:peptide ABC transporter substrate-binding protein n=1 Tax=Streptococcus plurextorum TaxID=456876 RepID=UPI0004104F33|nr:peptide ABC transporter substrate-binding protein [Streptococcus plurextorum]